MIIGTNKHFWSILQIQISEYLKIQDGDHIFYQMAVYNFASNHSSWVILVFICMFSSMLQPFILSYILSSILLLKF